MKVGYFVETPVEHNLTGGSRSFLDLLEQLVPMGVEPFVVVHEPWALTEELERRGIPFITTKMYRPFVGTTDKAKFYRMKYLIKTVINNHSRRVAGRFFRDHGVQLIHINSQFCGIVGAQVAEDIGVPFVYHIREFLEEGFSVRFFNPKDADRHIAKAAMLIGVSRAIVNSLSDRFPNTPACLIYNGLDFSKYGWTATSRFNGTMIDAVIVGRVTEAKNQLEAVKAIQLAREDYGINCRLIIIGAVGNEPYENCIQEYISNHHLEGVVQMVPFISHPEKIMHNCDIGLVCSRSEAFGRSTIESMMSNLLTIASRIKATDEIIHDGVDGILYQLDDPQELASKIAWASSHREEANRIANAGMKKAKEQFGIQKTAQKVYELYLQTCGKENRQ